jgi:hypothetical protein
VDLPKLLDSQKYGAASKANRAHLVTVIVTKDGIAQMTKDDLVNLLRITGAQETAIDAVCAAYDAGWNDALDDYQKRLVVLPFEKDTLDSFSVFIKSAKK